VDTFCRELKLKNPKARRLRCLGHVINLAVKAFLFGKEEVCFDFEVSELRKMKFAERQALELLVFWRKKGPIRRNKNCHGAAWHCLGSRAKLPVASMKGGARLGL
jgi:hypothetical protein